MSTNNADASARPGRWRQLWAAGFAGLLCACCLGVSFEAKASTDANANANANAANQLSLPVVKPAISCEDLAHADLSHATDAPVTITSTAKIDTAKGSFCKVLGNIEPTIGFEVDLPMEHWTQRFLQGGCGGLCGMTNIGVTNANACAPALNGEFAVAGNDMGHKGPMMGEGQADFGADPQKRIDFAYRANHVTAQVAKALIKAYYGQSQRFAYFTGCSDGGREALMEAQRFPDDFDGISAGAPVALFQVQNSFYQTWTVQANRRADGSNILLQSRLPILHAAVLAHCQTLSGVTDGLLQDPRACKVDPAWAQCTGNATDTSSCLTAEEVAVARKFYDGPTDATGKRFTIGGAEPGSELQWMIARTAHDTPGPADIAGQSLKLIIMPEVDPAAADLSRFTFDDTMFKRVTELAPLYNATNTNLRPFAQHGGKLILWHGWADTSVTPAVSIAYYQGVQKELGAAQTDQFLRLFMLPGVSHCGGGDGYSQVDFLTPLMTWTELQRAPVRVMSDLVPQREMRGPPPIDLKDVKDAAPNGPPPGPRLHAPIMRSSPLARPGQTALATRPVFAYPYVARYTGQGDPHDAANYVAVKSPVTLPQAFDSYAEQLIGPDNQKFYRVVDGKLQAQ